MRIKVYGVVVLLSTAAFVTLWHFHNDGGAETFSTIEAKNKAGDCDRELSIFDVRSTTSDQPAEMFVEEEVRDHRHGNGLIDDEEIITEKIATPKGTIYRKLLSIQTSPGVYQFVKLEFLDEDVVHVECGQATSAFPVPSSSSQIFATPMVDASFVWPGVANDPGTSSPFVTSKLRVELTTVGSDIQVSMKKYPSLATLTTIKPFAWNSAWKGFDMTREQATNVFGLGQQFNNEALTNGAVGNWVAGSNSKKRVSKDPNGNMMIGSANWNGEIVGDTQFPLFYAVNSYTTSHHGYAIFFDNQYRSEFDFNSNPNIDTEDFTARMYGDILRYYFFAGDQLIYLRKRVLNLLGNPLVPPMKAFGMWVSEFGYDSWNEIDGPVLPSSGILTHLVNSNFPVDGVVLDLYWFKKDSQDRLRMGALAWDNATSSRPFYHSAGVGAKVSGLRTQGVGLVCIEESYIDTIWSSHSQLMAQTCPNNNGRGLVTRKSNNAQAQYLTCTNPPTVANQGCTSGDLWWGSGGMIDWTCDTAADWWHDNYRKPNIIDLGIMGHWTDLGEPEMYGIGTEDGHYQGFNIDGLWKGDQADVHNLYNFMWHQSISRGYTRQGSSKRPFLLTRSGAPGIQRFGAAMWSGDIPTRIDHMVAHMYSQAHMSMSGIDYYGTDIGGFHRGSLPAGWDFDQLFTQWFGNSAWLDVPVRPHTDNSATDSNDNTFNRETSPARVGWVNANRNNIRQRYELGRYYYSWAHNAFLNGDAVFPPLFYVYQTFPSLATVQHMKLVGRDILIGIVGANNEIYRDITFPPGRWINYHTKEYYDSGSGVTTLSKWPEYLGGFQDFKIPAFVRGGAILPKMDVDDYTSEITGQKRRSSQPDVTRLIAEAYVDPAVSTYSFTLYEDDGETTAYKTPSTGRRDTVLTNTYTSSTVQTVTIGASTGWQISGTRDYEARLIAEFRSATDVKVKVGSGQTVTLTNRVDAATYAANSNGFYYNAALSTTFAKYSGQAQNAAKVFTFTTTPLTATASANFVVRNVPDGGTVYIIGNVAALGNWGLCNAVEASWRSRSGTNSNVWSVRIPGIPVSTAVQWKTTRLPSGTNRCSACWANDANSAFSTTAGGNFAGTFERTESSYPC